MCVECEGYWSQNYCAEQTTAAACEQTSFPSREEEPSLMTLPGATESEQNQELLKGSVETPRAPAIMPPKKEGGGMRVQTSFLTPTRPVAQCGLKLIFILSPAWFGIRDYCSLFCRHAISYTREDPGKSGRHKKSDYLNKTAWQTNPFGHHSWFGHAAHPAPTVSQLGPWTTTTRFCTVFYKLISWHFTIDVPIFEVGGSQAVRRC